MDTFLSHLFEWLSMPTVGLPAIGLISFLSATFLPMGSEPVVFAYVKSAPHMFWAAIIVATIGNTLGGMVTWWMGRVAKFAKDKIVKKPHKNQEFISKLFRKFGPKTLLLSWLPGIGDPICALAGWALMPWVPCLIYMAVGKLCRYITMTIILMAVPDHVWQDISSILLKPMGF